MIMNDHINKIYDFLNKSLYKQGALPGVKPGGKVGHKTFNACMSLFAFIESG